MSVATDLLVAKVAEYVVETRRLHGLVSTTEETFYPAIRDLLSTVLRSQNLPFEVRTGTSEAKAGGTDRPDFILADFALFVGVFGEVKKPDATLGEIAASTERDDQIGRYLTRTGVALITNVGSFGLLACAPSYVRTPGTAVPPGQRELICSVDLWASASGKAPKLHIDDTTVENSSPSSHVPSPTSHRLPIPPILPRSLPGRPGTRRTGCRPISNRSRRCSTTTGRRSGFPSTSTTKKVTGSSGRA